MAKILVADDNSNVQKTAALALAELGVEVVSVNNGEAAVRKLSDFSPDLILADIFMPVRNGYEVCEYVKKDSRFSRVPVVLLIGAFDPLDEREAQRVGADGILKKPFVPPDPLITMVRTLLDRTMGQRLAAVAATKPAAIFVQARSGGHAIAEVNAPAPDASEEASSSEVSVPIERVAFGDGNHPVAFGTLLETPVQAVAAPAPTAEPAVDDEQILTSSRDATLGDPIFWKNDSLEPEPEAERSEEVLPVVEPRAWKQEEDSLPRREDAIVLQPVELVHDEVVETPPVLADPEPITLDPAAQSALTVEPDKAEDLAENPIEWMSTAPAIHPEEEVEPTRRWNAPISDTTNATDAIDRVESLALDLANHSRTGSAEVSAPSGLPVLEHTAPTVTEKAPEQPDAAAPAWSESPVAVPQKADTAFWPSTQSAEDTARSIPKQTWADLSASLDLNTGEPASSRIKPMSAPSVEPSIAPAVNSQAAHATPEQAASPDPALVEAVVQRVLEKMRPQVVDIITKEFLRPIVQALVHREIEKH